MMTQKTYILIITILFSFIISSCFKEDEKVPAYHPGDLETMNSNVGDTYSQQIYFDFTTKENVSTHENRAWDLAFECKEDGWHILLNSALMMWAGNTYDTNFAFINSSEGITMNFDVSSGNLDSTAIGEWYESDGELLVSKKQVYIIDRGIDDVGNVLGFKKVSFDFNEGNYVIRYANLDGTEEESHVIGKEEDYNFSFFSFENGSIAIEPPKDEWSLKFSRYSTILFTNEGEAYPYNVLGVLLNPNMLMANMNHDDFLAISLQDTAKYEFKKSADVIGYAWKEYNFDDGVYTIIADKNYLIKNYDGFYYKMRFTRFYDDQGRKGSITYEFLRL